MTLPTLENLARYAPFAALRKGIAAPWNSDALAAALRLAEILAAQGETDELALFYGFAKEAPRIGPLAIHLALRFIVQSLQDRGRGFGGVSIEEMRRVFVDVGSGGMNLEDLRSWIEERTSLPP